VFADQRHVAFEVTWSLYQSVIEAYQADQPAEGKKIMTRLITSIQSSVPASLEELRSLGQTMKRRRDDILAFFDHPGTSNGPTEAVNGLLEHLRGTARGFRSIINHIARCLLDTGGFKPLTHSLL
jgi:transposase